MHRHPSGDSINVANRLGWMTASLATAQVMDATNRAHHLCSMWSEGKVAFDVLGLGHTILITCAFLLFPTVLQCILLHTLLCPGLQVMLELIYTWTHLHFPLPTECHYQVSTKIPPTPAVYTCGGCQDWKAVAPSDYLAVLLLPNWWFCNPRIEEMMPKNRMSGQEIQTQGHAFRQPPVPYMYLYE